MEIGRSLDQVDSKVRQLNDSLRQSTNLTRELDKSIKLDPKNVEAMANKMTILKEQIGMTTQKVALLKQKQQEANKAFQNGEISAKEYNKIEVAVLKAENELKRYNVELENASNEGTIKKIGKISTGFDNVERTLKKSQKALRTFSRLALALVTTVTASITAFTKQTNALNEEAKALDVSVEKLQLQRNVYKEITGDANNYDSALTSLKSVMTSIALGQGKEYVNILKRLGVSTTDLEGNTKSLSQIYDETSSALLGLEDASLRNSLAYELFGDNAINILEVLQTSNETIEELNEKQLELGITNEQQVATAQEISQTWDEMKLKFQEVSVELAKDLLPLVQTICEFVKESLIPILSTIAGWFSNLSPFQQKFAVFLLLIIILLQKIVSIFTAIIAVVKAITVACYGAAGGVGAVSTASIPLIPICLAVVAVVLTLALLFAFLTGRSKELSKQLESQTGVMSDLETSYSDLGDVIDINATQVSENSNSNNQEIHVDIEAHGDTEISQESADLVADKLAERINKELGGKI